MMIYNYDHCDEEQKTILNSTPYFFLSKEEQVNFHFMMHQRNKLKSPNFMASFEGELLASKFQALKDNCPYFDDIDYTKSFIPLKEYKASEIDRQTFQKKITDINHPPILVRGLISDSLAVQEWTHEYLMKNYEDVEIVAFDYSGQQSYNPNCKKMRLAEIIRNQLDKKSEKHYYINNSAEFFKDYPHLIDHVGADKVLDLFGGHSVNSFSQIFIGNLATWGTSWHLGNDISCALMVNGAKRWYFIDPRLAYILRPFLNGANGMGTLTDARFSLDFHKIQNPLYAYAPKFYFDLEPGDAVFFTKFWPHAVINLTPLQIMANMRMTEVNLETMQKGKATPTLLPIYDNILNSDPDFMKFKFDVFQNLSQKGKSLGDKNYFSAYATADTILTD